ncbi:MAG: GNAT family N-acetyltransferase [Acidobacteria bacterium]|nr:GNAT family N-acetyltransferase [Acidobacteriota bacterium]
MSSPEESFIIREYKPADFQAICDIDRKCFSEAIAYSPEEMAFGFVQRGAFALVAEHSGSIVGFVLAYQKKQPIGHIVTIDILPEFRRAGLGRKFMEIAEEQLKARGATRVILEVSVNNEGAIRFYNALGYATRRWLRSYYPDGTDAWLMEKALAAQRL